MKKPVESIVPTMHNEEHHKRKKKYTVKGYHWKKGTCKCDVYDFDIFEDAVAFIKDAKYHTGKIFSEIGEMIHELVDHTIGLDDHHDHGHGHTHHGHGHGHGHDHHDHYA